MHLLPIVVLSVALSACGPARETCSRHTDCPDGLCDDGHCVAPVEPEPRPMDAGGLGDGGVDAGGAEACESGITCAGACCHSNERCAHGACVVDLGPCASNDDCAGDSYCDESSRCTPYGTPPGVTNDPSCERPVEIGTFAPDEQCSWEGPAGGGELSTWANVYSAPMVADFDLDDDPTVLSPSIVIATFDNAADGAVMRILDGRTCEEQMVLGDPADRLVYATNFAVADLDAGPDGRPEIVAASLAARETAGGLVAFGYDEAAGTFVRRWYGRRCDLPGEPRHVPNDWHNCNGPSIHDLDDDGVPEVLFDGLVYDADGCLLNPGGAYDHYINLGLFSVVNDVDVDGEPELVRPSSGVYEWSASDGAWVLESYWAPTSSASTRMGHVAVADFGDFPGARGDAPGNAEIVVASAAFPSARATTTGTVRVMTIAGDIVFGPFPLPNEPRQPGGRGGPPTIGDFDGDGRRELAVAGGSRYTVFDLDCDLASGSGPGCTRAAGLPRGVLWSRRSQDVTSNVTGSSVFDFDADGVAEVVYGDECFLRIYRGTDGEVLFSTSASNQTGYEMPVIADVDGDFNSEIVVALTGGFVRCPATDPIFSRGTARFERKQGIRVLRDVDDRWAASRPIWNQHAYSVTNVADDGTIPRTSAWLRNHSDPVLNNYRMNAQGTLEELGAADLTVALARIGELCDAEGAVELAANVCNRGTNPVADGARVVFYEGDPDEGADVACESALPRLLEPSACTEVRCRWTVPAGGGIARGVTVVVDPDGEVFECRNGNNRGVVPDVYCLI